MEITHPDLQAARVKIHGLCAKMAAAPGRGRLIVIFGENGSGKSRILKCVNGWFNVTSNRFPLVSRTDIEEGLGVTGTAYSYFVHWPSVIDDFQKTKVAINTDEMYKSNLCCIDDVGAEHDPSGYGQEQLYLVLTKREFKWSIVTTNVMPDKWKEKFERRIASRLFRNADHIDLSKVPDFSIV